MQGVTVLILQIWSLATRRFSFSNANELEETSFSFLLPEDDSSCNHGAKGYFGPAGSKVRHNQETKRDILFFSQRLCLWIWPNLRLLGLCNFIQSYFLHSGKLPVNLQSVYCTFNYSKPWPGSYPSCRRSYSTNAERHTTIHTRNTFNWCVWSFNCGNWRTATKTQAETPQLTGPQLPAAPPSIQSVNCKPPQAAGARRETGETCSKVNFAKCALSFGQTQMWPLVGMDVLEPGSALTGISG